jgi:hypothetical protein
MALEVLTTSHEDAAAGVAELWLDGRLFGSTRLELDRRLVLEIREGPWELEAAALDRALDELAELLAWERPGLRRAG